MNHSAHPNDSDQAGRVALVTGAGRGIGAALVSLLAAQHWTVVAVDRATSDPRLGYPMASREELDAVVAAADQLGRGTVVAEVADTTDEAALLRAVSRAESLGGGPGGGLDAVVAVAGVIAGGVPLWEMPAPEVGAVLGVNLGGVITAARVGIPALLRRPAPRSGRFLAVASAAGLRGLQHLAAYGAAKAGVAGLVRGLAADLGASGVTANAICPGSTETAMLAESARLYGLADTSGFIEHQSIGRLLSPDEVAAALAWLAGPESSAITGAVLPVDGGLTR